MKKLGHMRWKKQKTKNNDKVKRWEGTKNPRRLKKLFKWRRTYTQTQTYPMEKLKKNLNSKKIQSPFLCFYFGLFYFGCEMNRNWGLKGLQGNIFCELEIYFWRRSQSDLRLCSGIYWILDLKIFERR